jgi:hypothetical protein
MMPSVHAPNPNRDVQSFDKRVKCRNFRSRSCARRRNSVFRAKPRETQIMTKDTGSMGGVRSGVELKRECSYT